MKNNRNATHTLNYVSAYNQPQGENLLATLVAFLLKVSTADDEDENNRSHFNLCVLPSGKHI